MDSFKAAWKFVRSFVKSGWELSDYPIRIKQFDPAPGPHGRSGPAFTWSAQVINWWVMAGHGYSRDEAIQNLVKSFERRKTASEPLPRPGTKVPLTFASDERISQHEALAADFMDRILGQKLEECFVSDQSSLWNFHEQESNDFLYERVLDVYGVDISDLEGAIIADILERIAERPRQLPNWPLQPSSGTKVSS